MSEFPMLSYCNSFRVVLKERKNRLEALCVERDTLVMWRNGSNTLIFDIHPPFLLTSTEPQYISSGIIWTRETIFHMRFGRGK